MYVYKCECTSQYESLQEFLCKDEAGFVSYLDHQNLPEEYLDAWTYAFILARTKGSVTVRTVNNRFTVTVSKEKVW